ncbi:MAG: NAD(P)(+) transhydrogenase (Re/Si-specific) subunit alpha, partial [Ignavibacteria bacterium]|nr:NAD(P)(+) transhydrogenase (Re/Si-specific) subunit alpha [Ignavibacteria bacterium]
MAKIAIPTETVDGETRVALIPNLVLTLTRDKHEVLVQKGAGAGASFSDEDYTRAGANVVNEAKSLYQQAEVVLKVQPPNSLEAETMRERSTYIGFLAPLSYPKIIDVYVKRRITSFSMEYIPRITRAQGMDALSSMATVAGYKAVLLATEKLGKMFP